MVSSVRFLMMVVAVAFFSSAASAHSLNPLFYPLSILQLVAIGEVPWGPVLSIPGMLLGAILLRRKMRYPHWGEGILMAFGIVAGQRVGEIIPMFLMGGLTWTDGGAVLIPVFLFFGVTVGAILLRKYLTAKQCNWGAAFLASSIIRVFDYLVVMGLVKGFSFF